MGIENADKTMKIQKTKLKEIGIKQNEEDKIFQWEIDHLENISSNEL